MASRFKRIDHRRMIRKCDRSSTGWNSADMDVAFQLFRCGMVWDGSLVSKISRDHFVDEGYAVRVSGGYQSLTGKGLVHFLTTPAVWRSAYRRWRRSKSNPFIATQEQIDRAMRG